jgi:hypothetical protein
MNHPPAGPKEATMHYKTIVLEMLQDRPQLRDLLQRQRRMLAAVEQYAQELKTSHEVWQERLSQARPGSNPTQILSEAMELALNELEDRLPSESEAGEGTASFGTAMAQLKETSSNG